MELQSKPSNSDLARAFKPRSVVLIDVYVLGRRHCLEQLAQTFVWERDIMQAAMEKNDLQSGSSS